MAYTIIKKNSGHLKYKEKRIYIHTRFVSYNSIYRQFTS